MATAQLSLFKNARLIAASGPAVQDLAPVDKPSWADTQMNCYQIAMWQRILDNGPAEMLGVEITVGHTPQFLYEVMSEHLYNDHGVIRRVIDLPNAPRIAALVRDRNGVPAALGLLMPTTIYDCGCAIVPKRVGHKIGLLGFYTKPEHRGRGYARICARAISKTLDPALVKSRVKFCLMGEARIVPWCKPLFKVPVIARWFPEREPHERP